MEAERMTAEQALKEYPSWVRRKNILELELRNFKGISEKDIIEIMNFSRPQDERVQTSGKSDKTSKTALNYRSEQAKVNEDRFNFLMSEYRNSCAKIEFLEYGISTLNGYLPELIGDMFLKGMRWDEIMSKYHISHSMVAKWRKKAIKELEVLYSERRDIDFDYMLS